MTMSLARRGASGGFRSQRPISGLPDEGTGVHINLLGGLSAGNVVWNMNGIGGGIVISSGAVVPGIFLAPDRGITVDHGNVDGKIIGGGGAESHSNYVSIHSSSQVSDISQVPLPTAAVSGGLGLGVLALGRRRRARA